MPNPFLLVKQFQEDISEHNKRLRTIETQISELADICDRLDSCLRALDSRVDDLVKDDTTEKRILDVELAVDSAASTLASLSEAIEAIKGGLNESA